MTGLWIAIAFLAWYVASLVVSERFADQKPGRQWIFFVSFLFSPLSGLLIVYLLRK
jgi:uncharacterized membrane protein HdeD (DUF308 family)